MNERIWKANLLKYILLIGSIALFCFSIFYLINKEILIFVIECVFSVVMALSFFKITKDNYIMPAVAGWIGIFIVLTTLLFSGGVAGAGLIWWALIPIISFTMFGLTGGVAAVCISVGVLIISASLRFYNLLPIYFDVGRLLQSSIALSIFGTIMYYIEKISNYSRLEAVNKASLLEKSQLSLNKNLEELKGEQQNQIRIRLAMLNLLEDSRELESRLGKEKEKANAIISSMGEGLFLLNDQHKIELMNPVAEKILDLKQSDVVGKDWSEVITTLKGDTSIDYVDRSTVLALKTAQSVVTNIEDNHFYLLKSGKKIPIISITTPLVKDGKVTGIIKVFKDVTTDKHSKELIEQEVDEKTAELSASIKSLPIGFLQADLDGVIKTTNDQLTKILGQDFMGKNIKDLKIEIGDDKEVLFGTKTLKIFTSPVESKSKTLGIVILFEDITEAKIVERSRDEFFSIASHELRTPLTAIRGNTALIQDMYLAKIKDKDLSEMVKDIHESSVRLIGIVNEFLNVSRLEMGKIEFKKEKINVFELAQNVVKELANQKQGVKLRLDKPDKVLQQVLADNDRTKEVLINLIGNSLKYTDKGEVVVSFQPFGKFIKILISDTGRGISLENQKLLFHKFQQAGSSLLTRDTTKSTGLGLYISKLLVEGMGGNIGLEKSSEKGGSIFAFTLPIADKH